MKHTFAISLLLPLIFLNACSNHRAELFLGTVAGSAAGAGIGSAFVYHGPHGQDAVRNTVITSAVVGLITGGVLAWHYRQVSEAVVELSGKYSRYRLCDSTNDPYSPTEFLNHNRENQVWPSAEVGKHVVTLDQSTQWVLPIFEKRLIPPETGSDQLVPAHPVWEMTQPGYFLINDKNNSNQNRSNHEQQK